MSTIDLGTIGVAVPVAADGTHRDDAAELERLGFSALWLAGGDLNSLDPIAELAGATESVPVVPAIIPLDLHGPATVAARYAELESRHPRRFLAGLGSTHVGRSPLAATRAAADELDAADPPVPPSRRLLAALGPRKLDLARERFAGAITLLVTDDYVASARETLGPNATLVVDLLVVRDTDPDRARDTARPVVGGLLGVPGYAAHARRMGFGDDEVATASDHVVDSLVAHGDVDTISARIRGLLAAGADHVFVTVLGDEATVPVARELAATMWT